MKTNTLLRADHQLDQLAGQFAHWRQTRAHQSDHLPHHLWAQAAALAQVVPYSRVAQHLRVSPSDLKKHMTMLHDATSAAPATPPAFVEVPPAPAFPRPPRPWRSRSSALMGRASACGAPRLPLL